MITNGNSTGQACTLNDRQLLAGWHLILPFAFRLLAAFYPTLQVSLRNRTDFTKRQPAYFG